MIMMRLLLLLWLPIRYDTIRDAVLTCNQKPTWVGLIYRNEPATKKWEKNWKKLKGKKRICLEVSINSPQNPWSQSLRRKGRLRWEGFAEKNLLQTLKLKFSVETFDRMMKVRNCSRLIASAFYCVFHQFRCRLKWLEIVQIAGCPVKTLSQFWHSREALR